MSLMPMGVWQCFAPRMRLIAFGRCGPAWNFTRWRTGSSIPCRGTSTGVSTGRPCLEPSSERAHFLVGGLTRPESFARVCLDWAMRR
eukprot:1884540-Alexandrium_andersonii.AAC.1